MDDAHKVITWIELRGTPDEVKGLLVEAVGLTVDNHRHRPEASAALIA